MGRRFRIALETAQKSARRKRPHALGLYSYAIHDAFENSV